MCDDFIYSENQVIFFRLLFSLKSEIQYVFFDKVLIIMIILKLVALIITI